MRGDLVAAGAIGLAAVLLYSFWGGSQSEAKGEASGESPLQHLLLGIRSGGGAEEGEAVAKKDLIIQEPAVSFPALPSISFGLPETTASENVPGGGVSGRSGRSSGGGSGSGYVVTRGGTQYYQPYGGGPLQGYTPAETPTSKKGTSIAQATTQAATQYGQASRAAAAGSLSLAKKVASAIISTTPAGIAIKGASTLIGKVTGG